MANIDVSWLETAAITNIEVSWLEIAVTGAGASSSQGITLRGSASGSTSEISTIKVDVSWLEIAPMPSSTGGSSSISSLRGSATGISPRELGVSISQIKIETTGGVSGISGTSNARVSVKGSARGAGVKPTITGTSVKVLASMRAKPAFDITAPSIRQYYSPSRSYVYNTSGALTSKGSRS